MRSPNEHMFTFSVSLSEMFIENKTLRHVDLRYNSLSREDCIAIGEGLEQNHTLLGLHMEGNMLDVDSLGFLTVERNEQASLGPSKFQIPTSLECGTITNPVLLDLRTFSNCWLCEGWKKYEVSPRTT